ncbi:MAG TPA: alpha/beta hydrolase-fold protein [Polyangiaceae bacterium]|jgi:enterochelin esterase-like enzyme|nr:alpha/beta hydrolase-fold protein [Polyangiaceae bacterium]
MTLTRRQCLALAALALTRRAHAEQSLLSVRELSVPGAGRFGKKCLLLRPRRVPESVPLPLLVLFHGLGETESEALGIHAWCDRYGLPEAYARLVAPPVVRTLPSKRYLSDARLTEIDDELARTPVPDVNLVCPFTPNPFKETPSAPLLDRYAAYIEHALLPAAQAAAPTLAGPEHTGVDGVSLGGYVALEIFLRKPALFGVVGTMQGAFGKALAEVYARRIAEVSAQLGPRRVHVTTSTFDPFRDASQLFALRLQERGQSVTLTLAEGPHDQTFLREAGSLEMLLYQARALSAG